MTAPYTAAELAAIRLQSIRQSLAGLAEGGNETFLLQQYDRLVAELTRAREALREGRALANACAPTDDDPDYEEMIEAVRRKIRDALGEKP